ncbi:MAG TPA: chromosome segregation protein SMC [Gemmatimonadaceae bacterium]|nr:chromosome segregation protein SMC [Gemmatimonadaceae bacterium]
MRLRKLELHGFKSFADHVDLDFESGVTAIVGPNGCGKSNVSDAVRWVLGEQRARLLRGAKMEEVIFQGSSARRPVNIAEVSLHFENDDGALPVPFKEVVITRRLSRSGESDYLLNRAPCRLRDIQDLVRGTGLGADSGVVIEARMIDALLSDRPDDRRELFEEAAGVGLYRDRKRSTERRLEETTLDLSRLDDLINEVQSQVRSLARQRKRAERHTELTARRFALELTLVSRDMEAWSEELVQLEERVVALRADVPRSDERMRVAERAREEAHHARAAAEGQRAELARLVSAQQEDVLRLESEIAVAEERQRNAMARRERAEEERRAGEERGSRLAADREGAATERARLEAELAAAQESLAQRMEAEDAARTQVADARRSTEDSERAMRELRDERRRLELDREGATREIEELGQRIDGLREERETLAEALSLATARLDLAERDLEEAKTAALMAEDALVVARTAATDARARESAARDELFRAEEAHTSLLGRVNALETLERERVGLAPAAAKLLQERARFGDGAILGPLSDFITAEATGAILVERFLGPSVHAVLVRDAEAADSVRAWHATTNPGPLLLLPLDAADPDWEISDALAGMLEAQEVARPWVRSLLGQVRPIDEGAAFLDSRGAVWLPGRTAGPGPLRRRAELFELRAELGASDAARQAANAEADAARAALDVAERGTTEAGDLSQGAHQQVRRTDERRAEAERDVRRATRELEALDTLVERLTSRRSDLSARAAELDQRLEELTNALDVASGSLSEWRTRLVALEAEQDEVREARTRGQVEVAQAQARLQVARDRERHLADEADVATARLRQLLAELTDITSTDSVLAGRMAEWQSDLETRRATFADGRARLARSEDGVRQADAALDEAERAVDDARRLATSLGDELHHAELRLTELSGRRTAIRERLEAEWRRPLDEMLASHTAVEGEDQGLRAELEAIREQLEAMGPVNPLAIEEHEEEVKRLDFLSTQRADLAAARSSLQQAIREIDSTARELFLATFTQVRENFRQIFMTLFGGGECDLRLEHPETPLDCDIEIHASPRGKRTQRIHLLSSGERALVALSLLFGIFLTKPSPFCLLDEVDAPLDDQNIGRFVRMLNQFKQSTQFIVITHNPRTTTEAADAVYGVTMQEPGVSSLVSVRLRGGASVDEAIEGRLEADEAAVGAGA